MNENAKKKLAELQNEIKRHDEAYYKVMRDLAIEIRANPTTDISTLEWERIQMKLVAAIKIATTMKDIEKTALMTRVIEAKRSEQTLDFGTPVMVVETGRFGIVTFIDEVEGFVYLDNEETPICQLKEDGSTDAIRLATQEEIITASKRAKNNNEDEKDNND